jgi:hypothetical protein
LDAARGAVSGLIAEINRGQTSRNSLTIAQLCDHFEYRELSSENTWRSYSNEKELWRLPETLGQTTLGKMFVIQCEDGTSRILAAELVSCQEHMCQNPKCNVRSLQSCMSI